MKLSRYIQFTGFITLDLNIWREQDKMNKVLIKRVRISSICSE